mmetsp:Transcript_3375/g.8142  ORF Transcript_3375/g.8142 Transcript_3375/m.8142 type:complete len:93 (-) Transcript_3375:116-394(-)
MVAPKLPTEGEVEGLNVQAEEQLAKGRMLEAELESISAMKGQLLAQLEEQIREKVTALTELNKYMEEQRAILRQQDELLAMVVPVLMARREG